MASTTFFFQECPTCGRHLRIRVEYLGRPVTCVHCSRTFTAMDRQTRFDEVVDATMLDRAERLLSLVPSNSYSEP